MSFFVAFSNYRILYVPYIYARGVYEDVEFAGFDSFRPRWLPQGFKELFFSGALCLWFMPRGSTRFVSANTRASQSCPKEGEHFKLAR